MPGSTQQTVDEPVLALLSRAERRGEEWGFVVETLLVAAVLIASGVLLTNGQPQYAAFGAAFGAVFLGLWAARLWQLRTGRARVPLLAYGSAVVQGLAVGWFAIQVTPDRPEIALSAFIILIGLQCLRLQPSLVAAAGVLYSLELLLVGIFRVGRTFHGIAVAPLPEFLRVGLLLLITAFLWYVVRSARSLLRYQAEASLRREETLAGIARDLSRRVEDRTARLREAVAQQAALQERERIAQELHDGLAKSVAGVALQLRVLADRWRDEEEVSVALERLAQTATEVSNETRRGLGEIRAELGSGSLQDHLQQLAREFTARTGIPVEVEIEGSLPSPTLEVWYDLRCIALEGLENVLRHSAATRAHMRLSRAAEGFDLVVEDDGRGLEEDWSWQRLRGQHRFGLVGIVERAERHGGHARIERRGPLGGCRIAVHVPQGGIGS